MSATKMDTDFAQGVRAELAAIGTKNSGLQRHQRRTRTLAFGLSALALVGATTGAAIVVFNLPGATTVTPLGSVVTASNTGTGNIDLGPAPSNATGVVIDLTCVSDVGQLALLTVPSAGSTGPDGAGVDCAGSEGRTIRVEDGLLPPVGTTSITITADPSTAWKATAQYATSTATGWGVNVDGQSYGVPNVHGVPDLTPARASNGEWGYVYNKDLLAMDEEGFIAVYKSDGTTVVGQQAFHIEENIPVDVTKIPYFSPGDGVSK